MALEHRSYRRQIVYLLLLLALLAIALAVVGGAGF